MRAVLAMILLCLVSYTAQAKQSPYPPVTPFSGDRYVAQAQMGADVARAVKAKTGAKPRYLYPTRKRPPATRQRWQRTPVPTPGQRRAIPVTTGEYRADAEGAEPISVFEGRPVGAAQVPKDLANVSSRSQFGEYTRRQTREQTISVFEGVKREAGRVAVQIVGGRPSGCPHAYCGCGASIHLFGRIIPALNLAANWLRFPRALPAPRMAAARRGHVFVLEHHISGKVWMVFDANSGRGRSRMHPRSIAGFTIVNPHGSG